MFHSSSASPDGLLLGLPRCHARPCKWESDRPGDTFPLASSRRLDFNVLFPTPSVMNSRLQRAREQGQVSFVPGPPGAALWPFLRACDRPGPSLPSCSGNPSERSKDVYQNQKIFFFIFQRRYWSRTAGTVSEQRRTLPFPQGRDQTRSSGCGSSRLCCGGLSALK